MLSAACLTLLMQLLTMTFHRNLQGYPVVQLRNRKEMRIMEMNQDLVMMRDGRMMVERNGELMEMEEDLTMLDGTRVTMAGTIMMTDGTTRAMMDGEAMTMDGRLIDMESMEDEDMNDMEDMEELEDMETKDDIS